MPSHERIAIVGAGIIGCATAFELAQRGAKVTIFDAGPVGGGATQASAGILAPYTEGHAAGPLFDLTVRGLAVYEPFISDLRRISSAPFEYRRTGTIEVAEDDERMQALQARANSRELIWLDAESLRELAPEVTGRAHGGLFCPLHAHIGVRDFVDALAAASRHLGVTFHTGSRVTAVCEAGDLVIVRAADVDHTFERVVLSAGAWTPAIDPYGTLVNQIRPVRGQLVRLRATSGAVTRVLWSRACYLVPWEDGTVLVGATSEEVGFELRATAEGVRDLLIAACELAPGLRSATFDTVLVGLRPATLDGLPILGPSRSSRVIYAAGHYRNGILLGPLTARLIADYVFTNAVDHSFVRT